MKALFAEGVERPQLLLKKKLIALNWPFLAAHHRHHPGRRRRALFGGGRLARALGEPARGALLPRPRAALRRRALRHPLVAARGLSALCRLRSSCSRGDRHRGGERRRQALARLRRAQLPAVRDDEDRARAGACPLLPMASAQPGVMAACRAAAAAHDRRAGHCSRSISPISAPRRCSASSAAGCCSSPA